MTDSGLTCLKCRLAKRIGTHRPWTQPVACVVPLRVTGRLAFGTVGIRAEAAIDDCDLRLRIRMGTRA
jgi:hypothetical protein